MVSATVAAASRAIRDAKLPRAMALADRASALAPGDPEVTALIHTVTEGGRSSRRSARDGAPVPLGVAVAGGAALTGVKLLVRGEPDHVRDATIAEIAIELRRSHAGGNASMIDAGSSSRPQRR